MGLSSACSAPGVQEGGLLGARLQNVCGDVGALVDVLCILPLN